MFTSDDVYIFNSGPEIFVWVGKGSSPQEKKSGLQYVIANNLPPTTPISRILEGGENPAFNSLLDV
jgi:gelsolin